MARLSNGLAFAVVAILGAALFFFAATFNGEATSTVTYKGAIPTQVDAPAITAPSGRVTVDRTWVNRVVSRTGFSPVAAEAYGTATLLLDKKRPQCHIGWATLAGIGSIETNHGTDQGSTLRADGTTTVRILGPALNGSGDLAAIPSDRSTTAWHGDPNWDHAFGPMQFIPSTWKKWGADGNGDGTADPNNMVDSAFTTGLYLCASGADLRTASGWSRAVFSYNHSEDYVRNVAARANSYAAATG